MAEMRGKVKEMIRDKREREILWFPHPIPITDGETEGQRKSPYFLADVSVTFPNTINSAPLVSPDIC